MRGTIEAPLYIIGSMEKVMFEGAAGDETLSNEPSPFATMKQ
jgi:hypothetical protein